MPGILSPFKAIGRGILGGIDRGVATTSGGMLNPQELTKQQRGSARGAFLSDFGDLLLSHGQSSPQAVPGLANQFAQQAEAARVAQEQEALKQQQAALQQQRQAILQDPRLAPEAKYQALAQLEAGLGNLGGAKQATDIAGSFAPAGKEVIGAAVEMKIGDTDVLANRFKDGSIEVIQGAQRPTKLETFEDANGDKVLLDVNNLPSGTKIEQSAAGPIISNDAGVFRLKGAKAIPVTTPDGVQVAPEQQNQVVEINGQKRIVNLRDPQGRSKEITDAEGNKIPVLEKKPVTFSDPLEKLNFVNGLAKQFRSDIEPFMAAAQASDVFARAYQEQKDSLGRSAAADLAMITKFMKVLDPGSVVRESEFAIAKEARGLFDRWANLRAQLEDGVAMTPEQREEFGRLIASYDRGIKEQFKEDLRRTNEFIDFSFGSDPDKERIRSIIIRDPFVGAMGMDQIAPAAQPGAPQTPVSLDDQLLQMVPGYKGAF